METPMPTQEAVRPPAATLPAMVLFENVFRDGVETGDMAGNPCLMNPGRISRKEPDPEQFYDQEDGIVYCQNDAAAIRAEEEFASIKKTTRRLDCQREIQRIWKRRIVRELAMHAEFSQEQLIERMSAALVVRWFPEENARKITRDGLNELVTDGSVFRQEDRLRVNPEKHPAIWKAQADSREMEIFYHNLKAKLPELKRLLADVSAGSEEPIYRFYDQSFEMDDICDLTDAIVKALRTLSERPFNKYFDRIIREGSPGGQPIQEGDFKVRLSGLSIEDEWLKTARPKLEAFFHAKFMLEKAVRYGEGLKDMPTHFLPSGWAALLYLFDLR
jgi:hypothetical protein